MKESFKDRNTIFAVCAVLLAGILSFSLYLPSLKTPFLFDDLLIINPAVDYSSGIKALLGNINIFASRPLLEATYTLNSAVSGENPEGYHFINIFIHFLNSMMLFFIIKALLLKTSVKSDLPAINIISFLSVIFFLVHPLASEAVIYISGRSSLLYTFFILLSFYLFLKSMDSQGAETFAHIIISLLFFVCALASKEIALILPAILIITLLFFSFERTNKKRNIMLFLPYPLTAIALIVLKMSFLFTLSSPDKTVRPFSTHIVTEFYVFVHSFMKILFPINLNLDPYFDDISSGLDFRFLAGFSLFIILIASVIYFKNSAKMTAFGIAWFLLSFSPHLVIRLRDYMSERWLYFPLTALPLIAAGIGSTFFLREKKTSTPVPLIALILCILTCLFAVLINNRTSDWQSDISIWEDTAGKSPEKFRVHANLGFVLMKKYRFDEAEKEIKKAMAINKQYAEIHYYLAEVYMGINDEDNAFLELEESLRYLPYYDYLDNPVYYNALINIGAIHFKNGRTQKAMEAFISAVKENPERAEAYNNIGILYMAAGNLIKAEQSFLTALSRDNENINAKLNLADIYKMREKQEFSDSNSK